MSKVYYHHCIDFKNVVYGVIRPSQQHSIAANSHGFVKAYQWLEKQVGFYPLFLSVGKPSDVHMTGYPHQWASFQGVDDKGKTVYRKAGTYPNSVLFSWTDLDGVFNDYSVWHIPLSTSLNATAAKGFKANQKWQDPTAQELRWLFKKSWNKAKWLRYAYRQEHTVQFVTKELDLRTAVRVWARNQPTAKLLAKMGFKNVHVKRLPCSGY